MARLKVLRVKTTSNSQPTMDKSKCIDIPTFSLFSVITLRHTVYQVVSSVTECQMSTVVTYHWLSFLPHLILLSFSDFCDFFLNELLSIKYFFENLLLRKPTLKQWPSKNLISSSTAKPHIHLKFPTQYLSWM